MKSLSNDSFSVQWSVLALSCCERATEGLLGLNIWSLGVIECDCVSTVDLANLYSQGIGASLEHSDVSEETATVMSDRWETM